MTYETILERNVTKTTDYFVYVNDITDGIFVHMFLLSFFFIVLLGGYSAKRKLDGVSSFPVSFVVASFMTTGLALLLSLVSGLVPIQMLLIWIGITVIGFVWLSFNRPN